MNEIELLKFDLIQFHIRRGRGGIGVAILVTCGQYPILDLDPLLLSSDNPTNHLNRHTVKKKVQKMWPIANIRPRPANHLRRRIIVKKKQ